MRMGSRFLYTLALLAAVGCGEVASEEGGPEPADTSPDQDLEQGVLNDAGEDAGVDAEGDGDVAVSDAGDAVEDILPECVGDSECEPPLGCIEGACECPGEAIPCGEYCVDTWTDPQHCGGCDTLCPAGSKCKDGECSCVGLAAPAFCGNQCTDLDSDASHCGACDSPCPNESVCEGGVCACPDGLTACGEVCIDLLNSVLHCGGCDQPCATLESCLEGVCVLPAGPRPLSPVSTSRSTGAEVFFQWEPSILGQTRLELCGDVGCAVVLEEWTLEESVGEHSVVLTPGVHHWRVRSVVDGEAVDSSEGNPVWQVHVEEGALDATPTMWGAVPDFNVDGFADVIIGACGLSGTGCGSAVFVFSGGEEGVDTISPTIISGPPVGTFGNSTSSAGDVNGDGYPDLVVGSWVSSSAYVHLSGPEGLDTEPVVEIQEFGGIFPIFGVSVSSVGDVNGDGYADLVGGNPVESSVYIYYGSASGPVKEDSVTLYSPNLGAAMGISADGGCDVNGDGFADVVTGNGSTQAVVFHGGPEGPSPDDATVLDGAALCGENCNFGISVACAGDVNGDGFGDVVIGTQSVQGVMVFEGGPLGVVPDAPTTLEGQGTFGISVAGAGDLNGDGYSDVLSSGSGEFYVHFGGPEGVLPAPGIVRTSSVESFGNSIAGARDVNGDGFLDVIVGAPAAASAHLYLGTEDGLAENAVLLLGPSDVGFGYVVAGLWPVTIP